MRPTTSKAAGRRKKDADPSRAKVYGWEDSWHDWNHNTVPLTECRTLVREACELYRVVPPSVGQHHQVSMSYSVPEEARISLQAKGSKPGRGGKNPSVALHEAAHHIAWHKHGDRIQDHGPTFLRIYLRLLVKFKIAPRVALEASARSHGLKW